jgi:SPX domain protein involved in polyphosphate accumulation
LKNSLEVNNLFFRSSYRDEAQSKLELHLNAKIKLRLWLNFWQQNSAIAMNTMVTSHLPVCLYSAAGKKVNRQDFFHRENSCPHPLHGGPQKPRK